MPPGFPILNLASAGAPAAAPHGPAAQAAALPGMFLALLDGLEGDVPPPAGPSKTEAQPKSQRNPEDPAPVVGLPVTAQPVSLPAILLSVQWAAPAAEGTAEAEPKDAGGKEPVSPSVSGQAVPEPAGAEFSGLPQGPAAPARTGPPPAAAAVPVSLTLPPDVPPVPACLTDAAADQPAKPSEAAAEPEREPLPKATVPQQERKADRETPDAGPPAAAVVAASKIEAGLPETVPAAVQNAAGPAMNSAEPPSGPSPLAARRVPSSAPGRRPQDQPEGNTPAGGPILAATAPESAADPFVSSSPPARPEPPSGVAAEPQGEPLPKATVPQQEKKADPETPDPGTAAGMVAAKIEAPSNGPAPLAARRVPSSAPGRRPQDQPEGNTPAGGPILATTAPESVADPFVSPALPARPEQPVQQPAAAAPALQQQSSAPQPVISPAEGAPGQPPRPAAERGELAFAARVTEEPAVAGPEPGQVTRAAGTSAPGMKSESEPALPAEPRPPERGAAAPDWVAPVSQPAGTARESQPAPRPEAPPAAPPQPVERKEAPLDRSPGAREISMEVGSGAERVSIRMAERAGEIRMAVVTPHRELAGELRARLPELVERLEHQGFAAETWKPEPASASRPDTGERREPGQGWTGGERGSSGQDRQGRERQGRPQWLEELDDSTERSEFEWQPFLT